MRALLTALTHDERVVAAAACGTDGIAAGGDNRLAGGGAVQLRWRGVSGPPPTRRRPSGRAGTRCVEIEGGPVHLSALPVIERRRAARLRDAAARPRLRRAPRERRLQRLLVGTFAVLALRRLAAHGRHPTRVSWRGWSNEIRRVLRGGMHKPEFQPLLSDVRELVDRLSAERELDGSGGVVDAAAAEGLAAALPARRARRRRRQPRAVHPRARRRRRDRRASTRPAAWSPRSSR